MIREFINDDKQFQLIVGDSEKVLERLPDKSIDCVITSPPYWKQRIYEDYDGELNSLIGAEDTPQQYVSNLMRIFKQVYRVLKDEGTFWLNIGDKYINKCLMGMPWRVALSLLDEGWILRSDIIWDQMKGTQSSKDRFRDIYEHLFQFVKQRTYYFNDDEIRITPEKTARKINGKITSATGVNGKKYREQIISSENLLKAEKDAALMALQDTIDEMQSGEVVDFRMTIRGEQRTYHGENSKISGRAKELNEKGYFIIKMRKKGYLPSNIWRIVPEDTWRTDAHYAVFPEKLLEIPIKATCPPSGIVLDPFSGIGSTVNAAVKLGRKGIGIDISQKYTEVAKRRIKSVLEQQSFLSL